MAESMNGQNEEKGKPKDISKEKSSLLETNGPSTPVTEMRSVVVQNFGGLKGVKVLKKPEPKLGEDQVLIRVKACGLNFPDIMMRQGALDNLSKTPFIMGCECAGLVEAVGEGVENIKVGDRVAALPDSKAWAELVVVSFKYVYLLPNEMSFQDAVAITMNFTVAHYLLFEISNLQPGQTVLVHSVGGGVGQALTQLAKTVSNVTLIGTASKHKHENLKANVTHLFDHSNDYVQEVKKLFPNGVDLVLDCLCGEDANKGYSLLKPMGRYVLFGTSSYVSGETKSFLSLAKLWWQLDKISPMRLYDDNKTLSGFNLRHLLYQQNGHECVRKVVEKIYQLYSQKVIHPVVDSTFALEDVAEGMQKLHDRKNLGKIILDLSLEPKPKPVEEETNKSGKRKNVSKEKPCEKFTEIEENAKNDKKETEVTAVTQSGESGVGEVSKEVEAPA